MRRDVLTSGRIGFGVLRVELNRVVAVALGFLCAALTGCASNPERSVAPTETSSTPPEFPPPEQRVSLTPFTTYSLAALARHSGRPVWVESQKAAYRFNDNGKFSIADEQLGPAQGSDKKTECLKNGAPFNDTTIDYPHTGIFVRGGELVRVSSARGESIPLKVLSRDPSEGTATYLGKGNVGDMEFGWAPCIAGAAADGYGHRLDSYIPRTASVQLKRKRDGRVITFQMSEAATPWLLLRYHSGAMIPSPYRMVEAGFDLERGLAVFSYRSALNNAQSVRKLEARAFFPEALGGTRDDSETAAQFALRARLLLENLDNCPAPELHKAEPCADPTRKFDRRAINATFAP
jgi:hypothetical protein